MGWGGGRKRRLPRHPPPLVTPKNIQIAQSGMKLERHQLLNGKGKREEEEEEDIDSHFVLCETQKAEGGNSDLILSFPSAWGGGKGSTMREGGREGERERRFVLSRVDFRWWWQKKKKWSGKSV